MQRLEFYKSIYDRENLRRESLNNSINIPVGILTALFTALTFLLSSYNEENYLYDFAFYGLVCLCFIFCCVTCFFLVKSFNRFYKGHEYKELPLLKVIENYYLELEEYYGNDNEKIEKKFESFLISELIQYSDINTMLNDCRSLDLYKAKKFIFFALVVLSLICILYMKILIK